MLVATLNLDRDVDKLLVFAEQSPVRLCGLWLVRHDTNDGGELARTHLDNGD